MNLKCFLGFHDWEYSKGMGEVHLFSSIHFRDCARCGKRQSWGFIERLDGIPWITEDKREEERTPPEVRRKNVKWKS